jgi:uncharacterized membrane protein YbhN (UPF0104 family)
MRRHGHRQPLPSRRPGRSRRARARVGRRQGPLPELSAIRPRTRGWALGLGLATSNWVADLLSLFACAKAIGLDGAALTLIVSSYLAGKIVSGLSVVPSGLGIVDAAMVGTMARGAVAVAAAVVLLYRLVSLAFVVAIGWRDGCSSGARQPRICEAKRHSRSRHHDPANQAPRLRGRLPHLDAASAGR